MADKPIVNWAKVGGVGAYREREANREANGNQNKSASLRRKEPFNRLKLNQAAPSIRGLFNVRYTFLTPKLPLPTIVHVFVPLWVPADADDRGNDAELDGFD